MKYVLIGCGRIAPNHINAAVKNKLEIASVCDIDEAKASALIKKTGIDNCAIYCDFIKMLDEEKP